MGPLLFQFPARFKYTPDRGIERLRKLHSVLSPKGKFVFEFRDVSWYCSEVYQLFQEFDWCLCRLHPSPLDTGHQRTCHEMSTRAPGVCTSATTGQVVSMKGCMARII